MINRKGDIFTYFGRAVFIVLFFFVIAAFSENSGIQTNYEFQNEIVTELQIVSVKAVIANAVQLPVYQKSWVSFLDKMSFKLINETLKISAFNNKIAQRFITLDITEIIIKPIILFRFYYPQFSINPDDLPALS